MANFDAPEVLEAIENIQNGNYSAAFDEVLAPLSEAGNPMVQCNLANLCHFGWGVPADGKKAVELYLAVAHQNIEESHLSAIAYQSLSTLYACGAPGIKPDGTFAASIGRWQGSTGLAWTRPEESLHSLFARSPGTHLQS
jgi:TPR repeat protein